jgi:DNA primase
MTFPPAFLDELRQRIALSSFAARRIKLIRAGREYKACCPFHNEKTPSFYINDAKQFYHCFGCGAHGDIVNLAMRLDGLSFPEAIETLAAQAGLSVPQDTPQERAHFDREKRLFDLMEAATCWFEEQLFTPAGTEGLAYLRRRGLNEEAIHRHRLGFAPAEPHALIQKLQAAAYTLDEMRATGLAKKADNRPDDYSFFRQRIMFPVGDRRGRIIAFGGRVMGQGEPKYLNSPDHELFHKGKLLYGLSRARAALDADQPLIVVEGYMDVIALAEAGYKGAVAPLGTALTEDQLGLLWRLAPPPTTRKVGRDYSPILCFDGDSAGFRAAERAIERALPLITADNTVRIAALPEPEDPDSLLKNQGKEAMQAVLDRAKPMVEALWEATAGGRTLHTPEERAAFMAALRRAVGRIQDPSLRRLYGEAYRKKLDETFHFSPTPSENRSFTPRKDGKRKATILAPLRPPRRPVKATSVSERILLALMVNYPALFEDYGEDLGRLSFENADLEALRQKIVGFLSSPPHETLDAEELYSHLSHGEASRPVKAGLAVVLSDATYMHAGFARPGGELKQAEQGWRSIWAKHVQDLLRADLEQAKRAYATEATDANLNRLRALRDQMEAMIRESAALLPDDNRLIGEV